MTSWEILLLYQMANGKLLARRRPTDYNWQLLWLLANLNVVTDVRG